MRGKLSWQKRSFAKGKASLKSMILICQRCNTPLPSFKTQFRKQVIFLYKKIQQNCPLPSPNAQLFLKITLKISIVVSLESSSVIPLKSRRGSGWHMLPGPDILKTAAAARGPNLMPRGFCEI